MVLVDNRMRSTWDRIGYLAALGSVVCLLAMMNSERRELRRRIQKFFKQKEMSVRRFQHAAPLDHKPDNLVHINIGTDEKPKYVWRVCK